jgi:hypothetical protein
MMGEAAVDISNAHSLHSTGVPPYPLVHYLRYTAAGKNKWNVKYINGSYVSKLTSSENGP